MNVQDHCATVAETVGHVYNVPESSGHVGNVPHSLLASPNTQDY